MEDYYITWKKGALSKGGAVFGPKIGLQLKEIWEDYKKKKRK